MKLKFDAKISSGHVKIYEESGKENPLYEVEVKTNDNEHFKMLISSKGEKVGEVTYQNLRNKNILMPAGKYSVHDLIKGEKYEIKTKIGEDIVIGENKNLRLTRSFRDRKMRFYDGDKLVMVLKCRTFIRNWLRGKYRAKILDESYLSTCICIIAVMLNVLFDEHNSISFSM